MSERQKPERSIEDAIRFIDEYIEDLSKTQSIEPSSISHEEKIKSAKFFRELLVIMNKKKDA